MRSDYYTVSDVQIRGGAHDGEVISVEDGVEVPVRISRVTADGTRVSYGLIHATRRDFTCDWFYAPIDCPRKWDLAP